MWPFMRRKKETEINVGKWVVFNYGTGYEFAECTDCGYEVDDRYLYPEYCPGCGRRMKIRIPAEAE